MAGHSLLRHWVLVCLLLLQIALVVQRRLGGHVGLGDGVVVGRHAARLVSGHLGVVVLGRLDRIICVDAIRVAARRLGRVQTRLRRLARVRDSAVGCSIPG
jgi:hypothetical protein